MTTKGQKKYPTAHHWFLENYTKLTPGELKAALHVLIPKLDADDIQDVFEEKMAEDGYFD